jgi:hypothetical protein
VSEATLTLRSVGLTPKLKTVTTFFAKNRSSSYKTSCSARGKRDPFRIPEEIKLKSGKRLNLVVSA